MTARRPHNDGRAPATIRKTSSGNRVAVWKKTRQRGDKPHERDERALVDNNKTMDDLYKERQDAIAFGADSEIVKSIDAMIVFYQEARLEIIAQVPGHRAKDLKDAHAPSGRSGLVPVV
jgi:hypothetical protein